MDILFLGGDKRYKFMMEDLSKDYTISQVGFDISSSNICEKTISDLNLSKYDIVIFPISGINDNMEIKTEKGILKLPDSFFSKFNEKTIFFTGLKTNTLKNVIPESQLVSFLDYPEVEKINNELTVLGTLARIQNLKKDNVCILGYGTLGKQIYLKLKEVRSKYFCYIKTKRTHI